MNDGIMKIAICDDDKIFLEDFKIKMKYHLDRMSICYELDTYSNLEFFKGELDDGIFFHAIFLDIEFDKEDDNGISIAHYIRDHLKSDVTKIIFISSKMKYSYALFSVSPFDFLRKPVTDNILEPLIERLVRQFNIRNELFTYKSKGHTVDIAISEILYFTSNNHKINIVCRDDKIISFSGKLSEILPSVSKDHFFMPHKSFLVNAFAVISWQDAELIMSNGDIVPISRQNKKATDMVHFDIIMH